MKQYIVARYSTFNNQLSMMTLSANSRYDAEREMARLDGWNPSGPNWREEIEDRYLAKEINVSITLT